MVVPGSLNDERPPLLDCCFESARCLGGRRRERVMQTVVNVVAGSK